MIIRESLIEYYEMNSRFTSHTTGQCKKFFLKKGLAFQYERQPPESTMTTNFTVGLDCVNPWHQFHHRLRSAPPSILLWTWSATSLAVVFHWLTSSHLIMIALCVDNIGVFLYSWLSEYQQEDNSTNNREISTETKWSGKKRMRTSMTVKQQYTSASRHHKYYAFGEKRHLQRVDCHTRTHHLAKEHLLVWWDSLIQCFSNAFHRKRALYWLGDVRKILVRVNHIESNRPRSIDSTEWVMLRNRIDQHRNTIAHHLNEIIGHTNPVGVCLRLFIGYATTNWPRTIELHDTDSFKLGPLTIHRLRELLQCRQWRNLPDLDNDPSSHAVAAPVHGTVVMYTSQRSPREDARGDSPGGTHAHPFWSEAQHPQLNRRSSTILRAHDCVEHRERSLGSYCRVHTTVVHFAEY